MPDSIPIDTRPIPYISIPLRCPLCGAILRVDFIEGFGDRHEHLLLQGLERKSDCPNEGRCFVIDSNLKVREV